MLFGMTYYQIGWYFLIYSFSGWVVEVIFHAVSKGKIINRGFLNGPVCPIYGFGVLAVFILINFLQEKGMPINDLTVFLFGMFLSTLVELLGGWLLDKCFHARWWDYTENPLNFHGYICLKFSILWGIAILMVVRNFQKYMEKIPLFQTESKLGWTLLVAFLLLYFSDFLITVAIIQGVNKKLHKLDEMQKEMRLISDKLSSTIGEKSILATQKVEEERVQASLAKAELRDFISERKNETEKELHTRYEEVKNHFDDLASSLVAHKVFGYGRLLKAFPQMKHRHHSDLVEMLKNCNKKE